MRLVLAGWGCGVVFILILGDVREEIQREIAEDDE